MLRRLSRALFLLLILFLAVLLWNIRFDHPAAEVEARHAQPPSTFVDVDGMRVHMRERGAGPVLVLLHGSNSSLFTWEGWSKDLSADHRVITLDLPGHGLTGPHPRDLYTTRDMADFLDHFVDKLGVRRFSLAGNSMGGHIALAYTLAHPDRVEKLILVDAGGLPRDEPRPFVLRLMAAPVVGHIARWVSPRFLVARSVRDVYGDPGKVTEEDIDLYDDLLLRAGNREASRIRLSAPEDRDTPRRLGELHLPVLILWGARDRWIQPKYGQRLRDAIPGARLVLLDGLGHVPMEEDPKTTAALVRSFLL